MVKLSDAQMAKYIELTQADIAQALEKRKTKAMEKMSRGMVKTWFLHFLEVLNPYLVIVLIIVVIVLLVKKPEIFVAPVQAVYSIPADMVAATSSWSDYLWSWVPKIDLGYRWRLFAASVSPYPTKLNTIPRQNMMSGRCDNLRWLQDAPDGAKGFCWSAIRPKPIIWELDLSKMPEYFELPTPRKQDIDTKLKVKIPYSSNPEDSFYVPRCDLATFEGVPDENDPTKEMSAAHLLEDTGTTCRLRELPSNGYTAMQRKSKNNLDNMENIPKSSA